VIKASKQVYGDKLSKEILANWIVSEHLERFSNATVADVSEAYVGLYSTRPTSWLAVLARNRSLNFSDVIAMETSSDLVRIPGMRRSKFILPLTLSATVFAATRLPLADHEWRLREVGLDLADFKKILPDMCDIAKNKPVQLKTFKDLRGLTSSQIRACTTVATYDGALIRMPPANSWSNRWLYATAPEGLLADENAQLDRGQLKCDIAKHYIENYGPITVDDLAWWLGISKTDARSLMEATDACEILSGMWISKSQLQRFERHLVSADKCSSNVVWFLPAWDPLLMGYAPGSEQRDCLGLNHIGGYDTSGNGRPVVLINDRAVTTWCIEKLGHSRALSMDVKDLSRKERKIIEAEATNWVKRIGLDICTV